MLRISIILLLFLITWELKAQDLHYSHHVYNPLYYNPAFTGFTPQKYRLQGIYADRYRQSLGNAGLRTAFASADMNFKVGRNNEQRYFGVGAYFYNHKRGENAIMDNVANVSLSYRMSMGDDNKHTIAAAFSLAYWNRNYNYTNLQFGNQFDGSMYNPAINSGEGTDYPSISKIDAGLGVLYSYDSKSVFKGFVGASAFHLIPGQTGNTEQNLPLRFNIHTGGTLDWKRIDLSPILMVDYQQTAIEFYTGAAVKYDVSPKGTSPLKLLAGPFLRMYKNPVGGFNMYTLNLMAGIQLDQFQIISVFDNTIHSSKEVFGGFNGFEVSLQYNFGESNSKSGQIYCPTFR